MEDSLLLRFIEINTLTGYPPQDLYKNPSLSEPAWLKFSAVSLIILGLIILIWGRLEKTIERMGKNTKILNIVAITVLAIFIVSFSFWAIIEFFPEEEIDEVHPSIPLIIPDETANRQIYRNKEYGFEFQIPLDGPAGSSIKCSAKQEGNKFIICGEDGQSVEIFRKGINQSLEEAIEEQFLKDSPPNMCWVKQEKNDKDGWIYASIDYPFGEDFEESPWENRKFCSDYSKSNGVNGFRMDPEYPDRFVFFNIGHDVLFTIDEKTWQSTFRFF